MTKVTANDVRKMPLYTASEAARFLHLPVSTVRAWAFGQGYKVKGEARRFDPVIPTADRPRRRLSFLNLVELLVLAAIRRTHHVSLTQVRSAVNYLKRHFPSPHPLAEHQFQTDGVHLFVEKFGKLLNISRDGQIEMADLVKAYLRLVEWDASGVPFKLHLPGPRTPNSARSAVVIDPRFGFGRPVLDGRGIRTEVLIERFRAGEAMSLLAEDYSLDIDVIEEVIRNHLSLAA